MSRVALSVRGLEAALGELAILKGVDLEVPYGEVHALMGPNGSGKSTFCHVLLGKAEYAAKARRWWAGPRFSGCRWTPGPGPASSWASSTRWTCPG